MSTDTKMRQARQARQARQRKIGKADEAAIAGRSTESWITQAR